MRGRWNVACGSALGALALGIASPVAAQDGATDYPQWRGGARDGSASAFVAPARWPETLTRRWATEVGEGYATPLVIGETVYTFTRQDDDEVATALDAATGDVVWRTAYPTPYEMFSGTAHHGEGPKATPLFHDGRLYTHGISGAVSAFDGTTGDIVWQIPAPDIQPLFGTAISPLADGDRVIVHPGYAPLTALDARTGDVVWAAGDQGVWASPIITVLDGVRQVVSVAYQVIEGVGLTDGAVLWQYPIDPEMVHAVTPLAYDGTVLVSGQDSGVKALRPLRRDGTWEVELVWEAPEVSMDLSNPVLIGDALFGLSHRSSGQYFVIDARTGDVEWLGEPRAAQNTGVVKADDLLFLLNDDAELIVGRIGRAGLERIRGYTVADSATWAQPAISGNRLFIKDVDTVALWTVD